MKILIVDDDRRLAEMVAEVLKESGFVSLIARLQAVLRRTSGRSEPTALVVDELPHVFTKFYRGKSNLHPGNGLGLALAHAIVTSCRGKITVKSSPGCGAVFTVALPLATSAGGKRRRKGAGNEFGH